MTTKIITIGFEGPHRVGKGTQCEKVRDWLLQLGIPVLIVRGAGSRSGLGKDVSDPVSPWWQELNSGLHDASANFDEWDLAAHRIGRELLVWRDRVLPGMVRAQGKNFGVLLVDRSLLSRTMTLRARKQDDIANHLYINRPEYKGRNLSANAVCPDLILNFGAPTEVLLKRLAPDDPKYTFRRRLIEECSEWYVDAVSFLPVELQSRVVNIDANRSPDIVFSEVMAILQAQIEELAQYPSHVMSNCCQIWQRLLDREDFSAEDDFYTLSGNDLAGMRLLAKLHQIYPQAKITWQEWRRRPTLLQLSTLIHDCYAIGPFLTPTSTSIRQQFYAASNAERMLILQTYIVNIIDCLSILPIGTVQSDLVLDTQLRKRIVMDIVWSFKRDFQLPVYDVEILQSKTVAELATQLCDALGKMEAGAGVCELSPNRQHSNESDIRKAQSASGVFPLNAHSATSTASNAMLMLSAPRSGSTLLRLLLAGNSHLFCPPELNLLHHATLSQWLKNRLTRFSLESCVIQNLLSTMGFQPEQIEAFLCDSTQPTLTIEEVYRQIQSHIYPRILVDKTPSYAKQVETLQRAEQIFIQPKYLHLVRHPYAMIDSFVRNRFDKLIEQQDRNPYQCAEAVWLERNRNVLAFSKSAPHRYYCLQFEELVANPEQTLRSLCCFLEIPFESAMLTPYQKGRMIGGPGDYDIFQHDQIMPELGSVWQRVCLPHRLQAETVKMAQDFGYVV